MHKWLMLSLIFLLICAVFNLEITKNIIDYDINQSKQFQKYCVLTHCQKQLLLDWTCKLCPSINQIKNRIYIQNNLTQVVALMGYHQKLNAVLMIFRGTQNIKNWIEDLSYYQIPYPKCFNCKVHEGFYASYLSISNQIHSYVEEAKRKYPNFKIYSLGSSLGAAIATLASLQIQLLYGNVAQLHSFGCPRVGNVNFAKFLTNNIKSIRRVIHSKDLVPHVPLISQNFNHPPFQIWFNQDMSTYQICNQSGQDPSCSNSLYPNFSVQDHISYWQKPIVSQIC